MNLWQEVWDECYAEAAQRNPEFAPEDYYRSGRASKAWPDKETPEWWAENGPKFVNLWEQWRDNSGLRIAEVVLDVDLDSGEVTVAPAIEIECWAERDDLSVKCAIDRVFTNGTDYYIVDLKTGSSTAPWPLQLALNNMCLEQTYGIRAKYGAFWSARKGGIDPDWHDLSRFTDEWLWDKVRKAKAIRDQELFIPNPNNLCKSACGVSQYCVAMGGTPFFQDYVTLAQVTPNEGK